ncbi:deaminase domain-containing protein, partial [Bacillus cereus group sp. N8]
SNIYNSVNDLISLSMPRSQFDEKLVVASKELEDTIQKVQQFESKKAESNAEKILDNLNKQVQIAGKMGSLSYTDPQLQAFFAQDALAKGIHEMDTQITKAEKEAQLQAERKMKKKREEWANHHPAQAWLQDVSASFDKKWDGLEKGTRWLGMLGTNYPALKRLSDEALVLEGFIGKAGSAISGAAIGVINLVYLGAELFKWGYNSIHGVETEQWKLDDIYGAWEGTKKLAEYGIVGSITITAPYLSVFLNNPAFTDKIPVLDNLARTFRRDQKEMFNAAKDYVEKAMTDPYAFGGMGFDIVSCLFGVGEVNAAVKGSATAGKIAEGENVFRAAGKRDKIVGKSEEVEAFMNKLPDSMKNVGEKIKNIEIPNLFPEPLLAGGGKVGGGGSHSLKDAYQFMKETGEKVFGKGTDNLIGKVLEDRSRVVRTKLSDSMTVFKNSDEYINLSNTQRKKIDRKIKSLTKGNVATADVNIPGIKKEFSAHSQIHSVDSLGTNVMDFSYAPADSERIFKNYVVDDFQRYNDTEAKILEDIASKIKDPNIKGEVNLFSELDTCQSCTNIILEFREKYPNIKLNIFTNNTVTP